ncbi:MAG: hypothetical protein JW973_15590 [Bacteroidales bacterium]|nr:hypothetical protein [Bacteroidales bacterium]
MEKVFLHTDKFIYKAGETVWFKGYITSLTGERATLYSNDLYIKLLDQQNEELVYRRYPIIDNMVTGYLVLPKSILEGKYYLLVYTSWMKNSDPVRIFNKELVIVKNNKRRILADFQVFNEKSCTSDSFTAVLSVKNHTGQPVSGATIAYSIQGTNKNLRQGNSMTDPSGLAHIRDLIPIHKIDHACFIKFSITSKEGSSKYIFPMPVSTGNIRVHFSTGHKYMLKNHENRISIHAVNNFGFPACCEGEIIDQSGKAILSFKTGTSGTGSFSITPHDNAYKARVITPPGDSLFILPPVKESGIYIDYQGIKNNTLIYTVKVNPVNSTYKTVWIASSAYQKYWLSEIEVSHNTLVEVPFPEGGEGLIQVSVFDKNSELCYDNLVMGKSPAKSLKVISDKNLYGKREPVTVKIVQIDPDNTKGNIDLSLSISLKYLAENTYNKDIHEYMVYENRFPTNIYKSVSVDTNAFLIFGKPFPVNWDKIYAGFESYTDRYYNRDGITGIVNDKRKLPIGYAKVKAINIANWKFYETQCDEWGVFRVLFGSDIIDFNYLNINAFDASGKITLWPSVDQDFSKAVNRTILITEKDLPRQKVVDLYKYQYPDIVTSFQYQGKKKKKPERETKKIYSPQQYINYSSVLDIIMDLRQFDIINNQVFFKGTPYAYTNQLGALMIIDGVPQGTHISVINNLTPPDIVYIKVFTNRADIKQFTNNNYPAVIEIITVRGIAKNRMLPELSGIDMLELNREFFAPKYPQANAPKDDNRTTLYWNPALVMPAKDDPMTVTFYTSDITGIFQILVQGFDDNGRPVSAQSEFVVK